MHGREKEEMNDAKLKLRRVSGQSVSDEELLEDLRRVSSIVNNGKVTQKNYKELGRYDYTTTSRRFGTWNKALERASLKLSNEVKISDERLFENLLNLWQHFGNQPRRKDLTNTISIFSQTPYNRRFGSWTAALENFINYVNASDSVTEINHSSTNIPERKTGRYPSLRLRYKVLKRDNFSCKLCGASPAKNPKVELHIDHITPWSKDGETIIENLQTLCSKCNLGKSNLND